MKKARTVARPFRTDYAGAWAGHCKSRESAQQAANKHLVEDGYSRCTVTDLDTGRDVLWITISKDRKTITTTADKPFQRIIK